MLARAHRSIALLVGCAAVWLAVAPSVAGADVVMPPPAECPRGAIGATSHAGPHCAPTTCTVDAECTEMERGAPLECVEAGLCVATREGFGGWSGAFEYQAALATCETASDCPEGTCEVTRRCATRGGPPRWAIPVIAIAAALAVALIAALVWVALRRGRGARPTT
jgi:hypothetical protein